MGITIHYSGHLKNKRLIHPLVEELLDISKVLNWNAQILDEDWSKPSTAKLIHSENGAEIIGHLSLKGIGLQLHPECESLSLYFDSNGLLISPVSIVLLKEGPVDHKNIFCSVKTQFAPPDVHISIIKLLKYLKKRYIPDLRVRDEGEYWQTENRDRLIEKINFLNDKIKKIENVLTNSELNSAHHSAEQLARILEKKLAGI